MKNSINNLLVKFFAIIFVAGLMASCASIADSGFGQAEQVKPKKTTVTTVNSDSSGVKNVAAGEDEMDPIIVAPPTINDPHNEPH